MSEHEEDKGFNVKDRRRFDAAGNERSDVEDGSGPGGEAARVRQSDAPLPAIDFSTLVLSLSTSAMVHLGETSGPDGATGRNLDLARQTIDILGMLEDKTRGNLTDEESSLLRQLLCDLRLRYVALTK